MPETRDSGGTTGISVALCVDGEALDRMGRMLRHLVVALADVSLDVRLLSTDPRIDGFQLGPVQVIRHGELVWPFAGKRFDQLTASLASNPPDLVQAVSGGSYQLSQDLADEFDCDLIWQVTSLADVESVVRLGWGRPQSVIASTGTLARSLEQLGAVPSERLEVIPPGAQCGERVSCFAEDDRVASILLSRPLAGFGSSETLVRALENLQGQGQEFQAVLWGAGGSDAPLRKLIRRLGLSHAVTMADPVGSIVDVMHEADIYVLPTVADSVQDDVLDALAMGMVVVSCGTGVCDYLIPDQTFCLSQDDSAAGLAASLSRVLSDRAAARRTASEGREFVRANHSLTAVSALWSGVYRRLAFSRTTLAFEG